MIQEALVFTKNVFDEHLKNRFGLHSSISVLNHLVDQEGTAPLKNQNKMVITLLNLEEETVQAFSNSYEALENQRYVSQPSPVRFNMDVLFAASFEDYEESLKFLNATVAFFQSNRSLNSTDYPNMPRGLNKLNFNIGALNYSETHNLWTSMGAKYLPSVIYKVRLLTIPTEDGKTFGTAMQKPSPNMNP